MTDTMQPTLFTRQTIRKTILIISFLLIPVTIFYLSPIVILMGAAEGVATASMILFILLFFFSFFVGRLWCGWLCPMGGWQEICSPVIKRRIEGGRKNMVKYIVTLLWLALIAALFYYAGGIQSVNPFYGTVNGFSVTSFSTLIPVGVIFLSIFIVAYFTGRRGFCHVFCPIAGLLIAGRKVQNYCNWPALKLKADAGLCIDCKRCSKECPMGLDVHGMVHEGKMENSECILCARCADTCPKNVISYSFTK